MARSHCSCWPWRLCPARPRVPAVLLERRSTRPSYRDGGIAVRNRPACSTRWRSGGELRSPTRRSPRSVRLGSVRRSRPGRWAGSAHDRAAAGGGVPFLGLAGRPAGLARAARRFDRRGGPLARTGCDDTVLRQINLLLWPWWWAISRCRPIKGKGMESGWRRDQAHAVIFIRTAVQRRVKAAALSA